MFYGKTYRNPKLSTPYYLYYVIENGYISIRYIQNVREQILLKEHEIIKSGVRILRPSEYREIRNVVKRDRQVLLDSLLLTGMRYEELVRLRQNEEWFDGHFVHLPLWAQKKAKRKQLERWIRLSIMGRAILPQLFGISVPSRVALDKWLVYNFPLVKGISVKTFRKTWESWLLFSYPEKFVEIALSQGHDELTQLRHYANLPFLDKDRQEMKEFVEGWV